jgi:fructose-1,6-bisphosphatase
MNGQGGIYCYFSPSHGSSSSAAGKSNINNRSKRRTGVPLLYVAAPLSYIVEQAGGMSYTIVPKISTDTWSTGSDEPNNVSFMLQRVLELSPNAVHERIPVVLGSKMHMEELIEAYHHPS